MKTAEKKPPLFVPGTKKSVVPFMRDVFTIPTSQREKPRLIGSMCPECEEYFFPKTGAKATCDNPECPRSTTEVRLSGRGRLLSATVIRSSVGDEERASAVILLEEGLKINSPLVGWEGFRDLLVPGTPVELVLQEMGESEAGETVVGYAFKLATGRRKPKFPEPEEAPQAAGEAGPAVAERPAASKAKSAPTSGAGPKNKAAAKKKTAGKKAAKKAEKKPKKKPARKKAAKRKAAKKKTARKKTVRKTARKKTAGRKAAKKRKATGRKPSEKTAKRRPSRRGRRTRR